ncbi:3-phenylpropionate/trans-cinnamate dioxygenase ferredoxin subunit [Neorhizobium galegae]|uniref:Rieske (2Fe-2S) protein n=1 Tax=Neorhizobium galegae TaxID=399 RepID=UPI002785025C|nr:Rieske (2Fe-2S) protein [Neorhizobium galegae]MDQ0135957.1 3-phenylpropionate/trans-cinnamate dioxygenase ferredoxin subunit [Neorhizobium galegae]
MARHVIAKVDEVENGKSKLVKVAGRDIALFNVKGEFFAIANRCPHEGADLCRGQVVGLAESDEPGKVRMTRHGELIRCPWHGWEFDIRTGKSWCDPARTRVKSFDVSVAKGGALTEGPYQAETFPVSIDEDYVVVEI